MSSWTKREARIGVVLFSVGVLIALNWWHGGGAVYSGELTEEPCVELRFPRSFKQDSTTVIAQLEREFSCNSVEIAIGGKRRLLVERLNPSEDECRCSWGSIQCQVAPEPAGFGQARSLEVCIQSDDPLGHVDIRSTANSGRDNPLS